MPGVHQRRQDNPLSNILGGGGNDETTTSASAAASTTTAAETTGTTDAAATTTSDTATDILGGLSSIIASAISNPTPTTSPTSTIPPTAIAITSPTVTPATPKNPTSTFLATSTVNPSQTASSTTSSSASASPTDTSSGVSMVAAAVVGTIIGLIALSMFVAFILRRRRRRAARESINFPEFDRAGVTMPKDENASVQQHTEQKSVYGDAINAPYQFPPTRATTPAYQQDTAGTPYTPGYTQEYAQQAHAHVYSPRPHHGYPSAAQQIVHDYQGTEASPQIPYNQMVKHRTSALPNPHAGAARPGADHDDAYGGI